MSSLLVVQVVLGIKARSASRRLACFFGGANILHRVLFFQPVCSFFLTVGYTHDDSTYFAINLAFLALAIVPKIPALYGVSFQRSGSRRLAGGLWFSYFSHPSICWHCLALPSNPVRCLHVRGGNSTLTNAIFLPVPHAHRSASLASIAFNY